MVTGLAYWCSDDANLSDERYSDMRRVISISRDIEVNIHDEDAPEDTDSPPRYVMKQHQKGCNSVCIRNGSELLASGSDDGYTIITNLISYRHEVLPHRANSEVKHVLFLDPNECLLTVDAQGLLTFFGVGENKLKNKVLFQKQYMTESLTNQMEAFPVTALNFYSEESILILGD
jgi:WD40 repeat protein